MLIDCVLTATNLNPLYIDFIPLFVKTWNKLYPKIDVKIIVISNEIPPKFNEYSDNIILFPPIDNISSSFISQYIRLLYPALLKYDNGILITDMDMVPLSETYYTDNIKNFSNDCFITYRNCFSENIKQLPICYNIATSKIWGDIFNVKTFDDIKSRLIDINKNGINWYTDQKDLYNYVQKWKIKNKHIIIRDQETKFKRLNRTKVYVISQNIKHAIKSRKYYADYHCHRPYEKHKLFNDEVYNLL